eukprot:TRINITY_DN1747_c0_g1_i7.p1 TRINITY_DN1747_c0_g1~~TRINITY_DN1747_c0_g1_i7.p1  ORF type:complete len:741 (-),score=150.14 TRINITY_DN1747_c0_g1_i7:598-2820(-)
MGIDLNAVDDALENHPSPSPSPSSSSSFSSSVSSSTSASFPSNSPSSSTVCLELWHACAGPLISLPRKGSFVVYLPQGHLEQMVDYCSGAVYDLPPHILCRVIDVKLHAEAATDEVYAQVSLVPESENVEEKLREVETTGDGEEEEIDGLSKSSTPHMFCKTLTASDTSTHGGFSVPRRAAEDCFPPLDYRQQRPSQELIAKDLHGKEWRFRHIYRGQPRRHLLTTGWSAFVNKKKLVSGDAVLFLRGEDGELRLGIRRAVQLKNSGPYSVPCIQMLNLGTLGAVANAVSMKSPFHIYYNPRASPSEFIIPHRKFLKCFDCSFSVGMRFKMRFESEDAAEHRYTGLITGIGDMDPIRWPGSKWRCLVVRWDDDVETHRHRRVSPWEIEPSSSVSGSGNSSAPGSKRTKMGLPVPNVNGLLDFGESVGFQKVLQGQEILGFRGPYDGGINLSNRQLSETRGCFPDPNHPQVAALGDGVGVLPDGSETPHKGIGFGESVRFHKVLQGQEILPPKPPYGRGVVVDTRPQEGCGSTIFDGFHLSSAGNRWPALMSGFSTHTQLQASAPSVQVCSPSSVLMFQQASSRDPYPYTAYSINNHPKTGEESAYSGLHNCSDVLKAKYLSSQCRPYFLAEDLGNMYPLYHLLQERDLSVGAPLLVDKADLEQDRACAVPKGKSGCRLFGFSLTKETEVANELVTSPPSTEELKFETSFLPSVQTLQGKMHSKGQGLTTLQVAVALNRGN